MCPAAQQLEAVGSRLHGQLACVLASLGLGLLSELMGLQRPCKALTAAAAAAAAVLISINGSSSSNMGPATVSSSSRVLQLVM
jgi:hypothetical protein